MEEMLQRPPDTRAGQRRQLAVVVFVGGVDQSLDRAMQYVAGIRADDVHAVHIGTPKTSLATAFEARYGLPLTFEATHGGFTALARRFVRHLNTERRGRYIAAVVPELIDVTNWVDVARHHRALRLKAALVREPDVCVINVPTVPADATLVGRTAQRHVVLVPVASLHAGAIEALQLAQLLHPFEVRAIHFDDAEEQSQQLVRHWAATGTGIPLEVIAAPYRDIAEPLVQYVRDLKAEGADLVTVVIGELVRCWWHHLLHNHRALEIKAALLFEPGVAVASVPQHFAAGGTPRPHHGGR